MSVPFGRPAAIACVRGGEDAPELCGSVSFFCCREGILVEADIHGLPESSTGIFAMHIHEGEDCGGAAFADTKTHYNPTGAPHPEHAGDLPPLFSCKGRAYMAVMTDRFRIRDVAGRTVVIHAGPDDFHTQPAGNSGEKIACGVIRRL